MLLYNYSKVIINPDMLENNVKIVTDESVAKQYLPKISDDSFKYLSFFAINSYMHAIGQVIATQICATKTNNIILILLKNICMI